MAKNPPSKGSSAKIRFIMLEADIVDGDINQITQAIQNAFRPNVPVQYRAQASDKAISGIIQDVVPNDREDVDDVASDERSIDGDARVPSANPRPSRPRKPSVPKVIEIDLKTEPAWERFAKEHDPKTDFDKFLTVAFWLKEHRHIDAITADHAYTCFRAVGWSTAISDFSKPLRNLRDRQFMASGAVRGEFAINHLGTDRVIKLKAK